MYYVIVEKMCPLAKKWQFGPHILNTPHRVRGLLFSHIVTLGPVEKSVGWAVGHPHAMYVGTGTFTSVSTQEEGGLISN